MRYKIALVLAMAVLFVFVACAAKAPAPVAFQITMRHIDYMKEVKPLLASAVRYAIPVTIPPASSSSTLLRVRTAAPRKGRFTMPHD